MNVQQHYKNSLENYDIKGESHLEYYKSKHPKNYKLLLNIEIMREYFTISGYWKDDNAGFDNYIVTNFDDIEENGIYDDDDIFFFGLSEDDLIEAVTLAANTINEFVITEYKRIV